MRYPMTLYDNLFAVFIESIGIIRRYLIILDKNAVNHGVSGATRITIILFSL